MLVQSTASTSVLLAFLKTTLRVHPHLRAIHVSVSLRISTPAGGDVRRLIACGHDRANRSLYRLNIDNVQPIFPPPSPCERQNLWRGVSGWFALLAAAVILAGCSSLQPQDFASVGPRFDPQKFFAGHTTSWGIFEDRSGANPSRRFTTDCFGRWENGELVFAQTFTYADGSSQKRLWHIRKLDEHRYEATASDVVGVARGEAYGNAFHWEYTVALKPGNPLLNVRLKQWMYLQRDGRTMLNRGTVNKFGVTVQQIAEEFRRGN